MGQPKLTLIEDSAENIVHKTSKPGWNRIEGSAQRLLTVKALGALYGLKPAAIYGFIKSDPAFPYVNVGAKKKFMIDVSRFETWLAERTKREKHEHFGVPTTVDLMAAFKNSGGST